MLDRSRTDLQAPCEIEHRRIGPLPDGWEDLDEAALVHVLERAAVVASKPAAVRHPAARPESPPPSAAPTP